MLSGLRNNEFTYHSLSHPFLQYTGHRPSCKPSATYVGFICVIYDFNEVFTVEIVSMLNLSNQLGLITLASTCKIAKYVHVCASMLLLWVGLARLALMI